MTTYTPGLHLLATVKTQELALLQTHLSWKKFILERIVTYGLTEVGTVFHDFPGGGFTGVICLTESHISIHTWPEYGLFTYDVFLSNFRKNNDEVTRQLMDETIAFFSASSHELETIRR